MRVAQLVVGRGGGLWVAIPRIAIVVLALIASGAIVGCATQSTSPENNTGTAAEVGKPLELSSSQFAADMVTPTGIGQD